MSLLNIIQDLNHVAGTLQGMSSAKQSPSCTKSVMCVHLEELSSILEADVGELIGLMDERWLRWQMTTLMEGNNGHPGGAIEDKLRGDGKLSRNGESIMEWIDARDKLPTSAAAHLVITKKGIAIAQYVRLEQFTGWEGLPGRYYVEVTHWQLLPKLPPPPQPRGPFSGHHHKLCGRDCFGLFRGDDSMMVLDVLKATGEDLVDWLNEIVARGEK